MSNIQIKELNKNCRIRTISRCAMQDIKKWLKIHVSQNLKRHIIHLENPEIFKYSEDRKCFKHLGELIDLLQEEQKSNDIIISSPFPFNKAENIHPNMNLYIIDLKIFCTEKKF